MKTAKFFGLIVILMSIVGVQARERYQLPIQSKAVPEIIGQLYIEPVLCANLCSPIYNEISFSPSGKRTQSGSSERTHSGPVEMLRQIPGPKFLVLLAVLIGASTCIIWIWANADGTGRYPLPELSRFGPIEIAALRGGTTAVIRAAVFSLWNQDLVEISSSKSFWTGKKTELKSVSREKIRLQDTTAKEQVSNSIDEEVYKYMRKAKFKVLDPIVEEVKRSLEKPNCQVKTALPRKLILSPIEEEIYRYLQKPRECSDLFRDTSLKNRIECYLERNLREFEKLQLIRSNEQKVRVWQIIIILASVLVAVGGTKLYLGVTNNKPSGFLVILLVGSLIGLILFVKNCKLDTLTKLGRRYLRALEEHYDWLKESANLSRNPEGVDPTLSIAIFGVGVLAGAYMFQEFNEAFPLNKAGGLGGGCGGGCGGGGCGGGCGGCGG